MSHDIFSDVSNFMQACGQSVIIANEPQANMYVTLITEELEELQLAKSEVAQLDAVCDLIWVLTGFALSKGWKLQDAWDEVTRSNMDKVGPDGKVVRRDDGKILKPEGWTGPQLESFV